MKALTIAFSLSCAVFAQQPRADIVRSEALPYDKTTTRVTVLVENIAPTDVHNVWVKVSGTTLNARRKIADLKSEVKKTVTVDVKTEDGPWRVEVESVDWLNQ